MEKQVSEGSLHKWFKGSKSKDGKGGWVNVVTGGTCASDEPGEGTPKCVSSAKRASMTKAERLSAARRKKKADPGQQQKSGAAKPTYVSTDKPKKKKMKETYERSLTPLTEKAKKCWPGYEKKGTKKMFGKTYNNCVKKEEVILERQKDSDNQRLSQERGRSDYGKASIRNVRATGMGGNAADPDERGTAIDVRKKAHKEKRGVKTKGMKEAYSANPAQQAAIAIAKKKKKEDDMVAKKMKKEEVEIQESDKKGKGSGTKDACYHKVKSRYSVWPSAYASGALVKCRKVGAANWGNSSKKEDFSDWKSEFIWEDGDSSKKISELDKLKNAIKTKTMDGKPLTDKQIEGIKAGLTQGGNKIDEGLMDSIKDVGKKVIKKTKEFINKPIIRDYPTKKEYEDSVKSGTSSKYESIEYEKSDWREELDEGAGVALKVGSKAVPALMTGIGAAGTMLQQRKFDQKKYEPAPNAEIYDDNPKRSIPVTQADSGQGNPTVGKVKTYKVDPRTLKNNPTGKVKKEHYDWRAELDEDWQKTNRQDKTDGMSKAAVKAYRRENPGSKLKTAVTKKPSSLKRGSKDAKRRKSFCSRMKGMKKRLTSAKTARDPDSRINKALRRWNC